MWTVITYRAQEPVADYCEYRKDAPGSISCGRYLYYLRKYRIVWSQHVSLWNFTRNTHVNKTLGIQLQYPGRFETQFGKERKKKIRGILPLMTT
jgi:hypothetical protein